MTAAADQFTGYSLGPPGTYRYAATVTPSDSADLANVTTAIWIGTGGGDLEVTMVGTGTVVLSAIPAGTLLPIRVSRVKAGSTTATSIIALW
jgi:hypothetical protein